MTHVVREVDDAYLSGAPGCVVNWSYFSLLSQKTKQDLSYKCSELLQDLSF